MSDTPEKSSEGKSKGVLNIIQIVVGSLIVAGTVGNIYVTQYKTDDNKKWQEEFTKTFNEARKEGQEGRANLNLRLTTLETKFSAENDTLESMKRHMADPNIHVTQDQMKNMVAAQLAPIQNNLTELKAKLEVTLPNQQKALDRIEGLLQRGTDRDTRIDREGK